MDRRKTIKTLIGGAVGTALFTTQTGCENGEKVAASAVEAETKGYGLRTAYEAEREERLRNDRFFSDFELETLGVLADIIVPADDDHPSATETGVVDFLEFMALDQPDNHQTKLRGGLAWINAEASQRYDGKAFIEATPEEQVAIVDDIAYPGAIEEEENSPLVPGVAFFNHLRYMVVTGFFTSKEGIAFLGYQGNQANVWDGPPQEVLDQYGLAYQEEYLPYYIDQDKRNIQVEWDDEGNVIT